MSAQCSALELTHLVSEKTRVLQSNKVLYQKQIDTIKQQTHIKIQLMINSRINTLSESINRELTVEQGDHICELLDTLLIQVSPPINLL